MGKSSVVLAIVVAATGLFNAAWGQLPATQPSVGAGTPGIAEIRSLADLRLAQPIAMDGQWQVRLGLADSGSAGGPWLNLYCLATYVGQGDTPILHLEGIQPYEPLGLVWFDVQTDPDDPEAPEWEKVRVQRQIRSDIPLAGREALFCSVIPLATKGKVTVTVYRPQGQVLAKKIITVANVRLATWQIFAETNSARVAGGLEFIAGGQRVAAMPNPSGISPVPLPKADAGQELSLPGQINSPAPRAVATMPATSARPAYPLQLLLEGGAFRISSTTPMNDDVELCFLARWWINGRFVLAPVNVGRSIMRSRAVSPANELQVAFGLPGGLMKDLKPGDTMSLQVAYCPMGWWQFEPVSMRVQFRQGDSLVLPQLSNRIEFTVTDAMLKQAATRAAAPKG